MSDLELILDRLGVSAEVGGTLVEYGFDLGLFDQLRSRLRGDGRDPVQNYVSGEIATPGEADLRWLPPSDSAEYAELATVGADSLAAGEVAVVLLAGGMATRFGGGVKALFEVVAGTRFLDVKVVDANRAASEFGGTIEMVLMTSFQSHQVLGSEIVPLTSDLVPISLAPQAISVRLTSDGRVFRGHEGAPSMYAPGHGDLPDALRKSGFLRRFVDGGGRHVFMTNVDNAAATLDPAVIGLHIRAGTSLTCEVTPANGAVGGAPYLLDGRLQIVEDFRIPPDLGLQPVAINTNSFVIDARSLDTDHPLTWFQVHKQVDGQAVVQFERLVGELSNFLSTTAIVVDSDGLDGRFQPVKSPRELDERRPEIRRILERRNLL